MREQSLRKHVSVRPVSGSDASLRISSEHILKGLPAVLCWLALSKDQHMTHAGLLTSIDGFHSGWFSSLCWVDCSKEEKKKNRKENDGLLHRLTISFCLRMAT